MDFAIVVLAAGLGSRYGGLKQLASLGPNGETLLDYAVFDALRHGFTRLVFVIRREFAEKFHVQIGRRYARHAQVAYVYQELDRLPEGHRVLPRRRKPWGTGHAVWCAGAELSGPFAVINADDFYGAAAYRQAAALLRTASAGTEAAYPACLIAYRLKQPLSSNGPVSRGICTVDSLGLLETVDEIHGLQRSAMGTIHADPGVRAYTGDEFVSMNFWGLTPAIFPALTREFSNFLTQQGHDETTEFYLPAAITSMIARGELRVPVFPAQSAWFGVTYREDLPRAAASLRNLINAGLYPHSLWS